MDLSGTSTGQSIYKSDKKEKPLGDGTVKYKQPFIVFSDFDGTITLQDSNVFTLEDVSRSLIDSSRTTSPITLDLERKEGCS